MLVNTQFATCPSASEAVHRVSVVPMENISPDGGLQLLMTGAWPPLTIGGENGSATDWPSCDCTVMSTGQTMVNSPTLSTDRDEGAVGKANDDSLHEPRLAHTATHTTRRHAETVADIRSKDGVQPTGYLILICTSNRVKRQTGAVSTPGCYTLAGSRGH